MVLNRGIAFANLLKTVHKVQGGIQLQSVRNSGAYNYRAPSIPPKRNIIIAEAIGGFAWWWILYHLVTEPGHIIGEFPYPDPSLWTDEELGIPPDDE